MPVQRIIRLSEKERELEIERKLEREKDIERENGERERVREIMIDRKKSNKKYKREGRDRKI